MKHLFLLLFTLFSISSFSQNEFARDNIIYDGYSISVKPSFPDGIDKLQLYIVDNIKKSGPIEKSKIKTVSKSAAMFVVEKDGSLSDIKITGQLKNNLAKSEAIVNILKTQPKWNPGQQNGQIVRALVSIPLNL